MVGGILSGSVVAKTKRTWGGGSSRVFRKALKALLESMWASSRMKTFLGAVRGARRILSLSSRTSSTELLLAASISTTSGWAPFCTAWQWGQTPQGRFCPWHPTAMARRRAVVVLPTPRGPEKR
jgi:hypothetical protein